MRFAIPHFVIAACVTLSAPVCNALTIVRCEDAGGSVTYRDHCPPNDRQTGEQKVPGGGANSPSALRAAAVRTSPVVIFTVPACDACDLMRHHLVTLEIPFTEQNVDTDPAAQAALKAISGGVTVPTTAVGKKVVTGYNKAGLQALLGAAGYELQKAPPGSAPAASNSPPH